MGLSTGLTFDTADPEMEPVIWGFDMTVIVTMDRQASGLPAGTFEPMELKARYHIIIKILL